MIVVLPQELRMGKVRQSLGGLVLILAGVSVGAFASPQKVQTAISIEELGDMPVVTLVLNGQQGRFLLDTGASETVIAPALAKAAKLDAVRPAQGKDSGGQAVVGTYVKGADLRSGLGALLGHPSELLALSIPPLERAGLAGVLSPQRLAQDGCMIVDFPLKQLSLSRAAGPCNSSLPAYRSPAPGWTVDGRPYVSVSTAAIDTAVAMLVDSGASRTSLPAAYVAGAPVIRTENSRGVAGVQRTNAIVGPVTIRLGPIKLELAEVAVDEAATTGVLGFDALQSVKIVLWADGRSDYIAP